MLSRIVDWYNEIKLKVVPCEHDIIKEEIELIKNKLLIALETAKWSDYEEVYIIDVHSDLQNLNERVLKAKDNIEKVIKSLRGWGNKPMYKRHEKGGLMKPEEFETFIGVRQSYVMETKLLIEDVVDENFRLFFKLPLKRPMIKKRESGQGKSFLDTLETLKNIDSERSTIVAVPSETSVGVNDKSSQISSSQITLRPITGASSTLSFDCETIIKTAAQLKLYRPYEEYLDLLILKEIQNALRVSLKYILVEMNNRMDKIDAPLFEVKLELQEPYLCFFPAMDNNSKRMTGLLEIVTSMIANILNMTEMIPLIAQPEENKDDEEVTFEYFLELFNEKKRKDRDFDEIENIQMDIVRMIRNGIKDALAFAKKFEQYDFLWLTDRKKHLSNFLKYGRQLTKKELEDIENECSELKEHQPELNDFRNMIEYYYSLYNEIEKIDALHNINSFLRVNLNGLKYTLLNLVSKWSYLFKEYLKNKVTDDLQELEDFIIKSTKLLEQEPKKEDYDLLLKILKTLSLINERERRTDEMFKPLKEIVSLLKTYDVPLDDRINDQFAELPEKWISLKKLGVLVKQSITSVQTYQVELIRRRIQMFDLRSKLYHEKFMKLPVSMNVKESFAYKIM